MRTLIAGLGLAFTLAAGTAQAQLAPFNDLGVTMGHWHLISKDLAANKKIFLGMGGQPVAGAETVTFPGVRINLNLGTEVGNGGTVGSVVNHVGFIVNNVQEQVAKWKANGVAVLPGANGRLDQAYVETPDGVRIEILEDKTQSVPVRNEHIHFRVTEGEIPKMQAWYAKTFGGKAGKTSTNAPIVDLPGVQLRFAKDDKAQLATRHRVLDHIGFDVKDMLGFIKKLEADGIKLDRPYSKNEATGDSLAFITDPWGTYIELNERTKGW